MPEMPELKKKYGFELTPEQMLYMDQMRPKSGAQIGQEIIRNSSPELVPEQNVFQRMATGAGQAADLVNKYAPKIYEKIPKRVTSLAPFGFVGLTPGFEDFLNKSREETSNTEIPTSFKFFPSIDTATGEMQPAGFGQGRVKLGKVVESIKPSELVGLNSAQRVYGDLGYGQAPEPMDVLDTLGLHTGMLQTGKAGFRSASSLAKAGAPYAAEGLERLVSKYNLDPRMNIVPDAPSMSGAVPEGFKLGQENGKAVVFDASGKIFAQGNDAQAAIFRANKRLENEAANAARTARREERAAEAPKVEEKPEVKIDTDRNAPLFYNPLSKAAANLDEKFDLLPTETGSGEEILSHLKGYEGVTDDHVLFSGIEDYIKAKEAAGEPVTKQDVMRYLEKNRIRLYEDYKADTPGTTNLDPDDFVIRERDLNVEDPDSSYLDDLAGENEEYIRNNDYDSILEDVTDRYPDLDEERVQEKVDEIIQDRARDWAYDSYYEDPYYSADVNGYFVSGNRDAGFYLKAPDGSRISYSNGREYFNDIDEVNDAIQEHLRESGLIGETNTKFNEREYPQYMMPGGENYRELNIGLERGSLDKLSGKRELIRDQIMSLDNELMALIHENPIISERSPEIQAKIESLRERKSTKEDFLSQMEREPHGWTGSHFDEPDLVAQLRLKDYQDVDGKNGTLMDEGQSDLHQKGREQGYRGTRKEIDEAGAIASTEQAKLNDIINSSIPIREAYQYTNDVYRDVKNGNFRERLKYKINNINQHLDDQIRRIRGGIEQQRLLLDPNLNELGLDKDDILRAIQKQEENIKEFEAQKITFDPTDEANAAKIKEIEDQAKVLDQAYKTKQKLDSSVPDAPFKNNWYHIAIRRAIKDAIDHGKDRVYIPTGEAISDRYNYAAAIDELAYKVKENGNYNVTMKDFNGNQFQNIGNQEFTNIEPSELDSIFGKAVADKMRERFGEKHQNQMDPNDVAYVINNRSLGEAIDVGGRGNKVWYDERYPNFIKKEAKEFGAETGYTKIPTPVTNEKAREKVISREARKRRISIREMKEKIRYMDYDEREKFFMDRQEPVFYIEINDAMRDAYRKGRPYARGGYVEDALDAVDAHLASKVQDYRDGGAVQVSDEKIRIPYLAMHYARGGSVSSDIDSVLSLVDSHFNDKVQKFGGGGKAEKKPDAEKQPDIESLTPLEREAYNTFGMLPNKDRLTILPNYTKEQGFIAPEFVYDLAKAFVAPGTALKGHQLTEEDALNTAMSIVGGKPAAKTIRRVAPEVAETAAQMAERYAMDPMYAVPPKKGSRMSRAEAEAAGLWHPISDEKLSRPYHEMTSVKVDNPKVIMAPTRIITPEDMVGKAGFPLIGDRAATGKILTHINDQPLAWPVPLTGGPKYMMANVSPKAGESAAWESGKGKVTTLQNRIQEAADQAGDVLGIYSSGSLHQGDFNTMMSDALAAQLRGSKITKKAKAEFDKDIRNFYPEFVGIDSPELRNQLLDLSNGVLRTAFVKRMAQKNFQSKGFPDVASTRKAIMDTDILEDPLGTTGFTIANMDTGRKIVTPRNPSGYPLSMGGEYYGSLENRLPHSIMFSSKAKQRRLLGADPAGDYRSYELAQPVQIYDQEWLDTVRKYMEQRKKLTGKSTGGAVEKDKELEQELTPLQKELGKAAYTLEKHRKYKTGKYSGKEDEVVSPRRPYEEKMVQMPGDFKGNTMSTPLGDRFKNEYKLYNMPEFREEDVPFKKYLRYYSGGGSVKITDDYSIAPEAKTGKWSKKDEKSFQKGIRGTKWYQQFVDKYGEPPDLDSKDYNYRAAWKAGVRPQDYEHDQEMQHWASTTGGGESLKAKNHPSAWMEDYMQITGSDPHEPAEMNAEQVKAMQKALTYRYGK